MAMDDNPPTDLIKTELFNDALEVNVSAPFLHEADQLLARTNLSLRIACNGS